MLPWIRNIEIFGDSILKGIQINPLTSRYHVNNQIDIDKMSRQHALVIQNHSSFGCTITKGFQQLRKFIESGGKCDVVVMDYGGNDCDFDWKAVSEDPGAAHEPKTPLGKFVETYHEIIAFLRGKGIRPLLTTLPPLSPQQFFQWFCRGLNQKNVLGWLGGVNTIYRYQENYSRTIEQVARDTKVSCVDLRGAFLSQRHLDPLLCEDGIHPNTEGQKLITAAFLDFIERAAERFKRERVACCPV